MAISCSNLAALKSGVLTGSNLISATKKQKYGYTPLQSDPTAAPRETFYFTIENENSISHESDVTDYYLEDNRAIQDHVSLKPVIITTNAYVGEVTTKVDGALGELNDFVEEKLTIISQYLPKVTATGQQLLNTAKQAISTAKKAKDATIGIYDKLKGNKADDKTKQQIAYAELKTCWEERTLFLVRTPWDQFDNCIIQGLKVTQDGVTENISNFEVTFKQLKFAEAFAKKSLRSGRNATQASAMKNLGASTPTESKTSWKDNAAKYASSLWNSAKSAWG